MPKNLVIVESPAKAKTIEKFLGDDYKVMSSYGHIRDLKKKNFGVDLDTFAPDYEIPADKQHVVSELRSAAKKASAVWLASDEDREGEAISWHLAEVLGIDPKTAQRIVFHEITKPAILAAIEHPRSIDLNLVDAQQARRVLDRLVGFKVSPVLWRRVRPSLSAGRVQSVAVRLIVEREREIAAFKEQSAYRVSAVFTLGNSGKEVRADLDRRFKTKAEAEAFLLSCSGASFRVAEVETHPTHRSPAPPFTTSTLQQEAARKLGFSVSATMRVAQTLYEAGLITYMRTDSTNLSGLAIATSREYITANFGPEYSTTRQFKTHSKGAQEAHEAIRPTFIANTEIEGTAQEKKLYSLIWKRTVASQMADARVLNTTMKVASDRRSEKFGLQATQVLFDGFLKLYMEGTDDQDVADSETMLPDIGVGTLMEAQSIGADCKFTPAPPRYSEATLVKKLEELGIGRPSTYAPTIATLTTGRGYIIKGDKEGRKAEVRNLILENGSVKEVTRTETIGAERGKLLPQEIGMIVSDFLGSNFREIMDYDFTANVEKEFDQVAGGEKSWNSLISAFYTPFHKNVDEVLGNNSYNKVSRELGTDEDGTVYTAKFGKFGPYVQKGEGENAQFASLGRGQLIETITIEEARILFQLPRTVGDYQGIPVIATKGRFGPYIKHGEKNYSLPKGNDPVSVTLEQCIGIIEEGNSKTGTNSVIAEFTDADIQVISGRYGPYIKHAGSNYKLPPGTDAQALTEEACRQIIENSKPTEKGRRRYRKS